MAVVAPSVYAARPKHLAVADLSRMTRFPKYIRIQRQRRILSMRMKVPPQVQQFRKPLDRNVAIQAFRFAAQYRPESKVEKAARLEAIAAAKAEGKAAPASKNYSVKFGLDAVTSLVESKKAKLVLIAHDVDPIEVCFCEAGS
jgi:large subunit ribosomal protein L7Ae